MHTQSHTNYAIASTVFFILLGLALSFQNLAYYLHPSITLVVILAIAPLVFQVEGKRKRMRYAYVSMVSIALYFVVKMQLLYFLSFGFFVLYVIESQLGAVNHLPVFILLLISPYASFVFATFGFPIRLFLTDMAAVMLSWGIDGVVAEGNNIVIDQQVFSVDAACMGLTMVGYGYAFVLLMIRHFEKHFSKSIALWQVLLILVVSTGFILLANLWRIAIVVVLQAPPETAVHEGAGLLSFALYFLLPMYYIIRSIVKSSHGKPQKLKKTKPTDLRWTWGAALLLIGLLGYANLHRAEYRNVGVDIESEAITLIGFEKSFIENNVVRFENDQALIYIKPPNSFFAPDHNPMVCWRGSGYAFKNIRIAPLETHEVFMAELVKGEDRLYTAWWYENGTDQTISQIHWRWHTAIGEAPYRLINVTAATKEALVEVVEGVAQNHAIILPIERRMDNSSDPFIAVDGE